MTAAAVRAVSAAETTVQARGPVRRMLTLLRPHSGRLVLAVAAGVAAELATLGLMALAAWLIARASQQPPLAYLSVAIVGVRAFATARGAFRYAERLASHDAALRALSTMRGTVFDALVPLAPTGLPAFRSGDLLSRMVSDVEAVQDLVVRVLVPVATAVVVAGLAIGYVASVLPVAALALAVGLALAGALVPLITVRSSRRAANRLAPARAEVAARSLDLVHGGADLAVFGATDDALAAAERADARLAAVERSTARTGAVAAAIGLLVQGLTTIAVLALALDAGAGAGAGGELEAVMLPVVVLVALIAFDPVLPLVTAVRYFLESQAAARRVMEVLDARPPVTEPAVPLPPPGGDAAVDVAGLTVRYAADRPPALDGVDIRLEPGRRVAVVGASGSGKSTLVAALMRFVEASSGAITWGEHDLAGYDGDDVRAHLTGVTQDAHLFHTTIRENLRLARPRAGDDELRGALDRAKLLSWVDGLPRGLDTTVGESGARLSGGQRQRLSLARALLADPAVLVLDEPTEGLDPETADALLEDLLAATHDRGTLLVTHRLTGLDQVDEIVVLDAGQVVQHGTHDELVDVDGVYRDLWWASHPSIESVQPRPGDPSA
jgi:thiol reductant ABC exporter CydC subunit